MLSTPLLPFPQGLEITSISETPEELLVRVSSHRTSSCCPLCGVASSTIHRYYREICHETFLVQDGLFAGC